jgi:small-conductance mechanosensitive channel
LLGWSKFYIQSKQTYGQGSVLGLKLVSRFESDFKKIDLIVVYLANLINVIMSFLFVARLSALSQVEGVLGIVVMIMGFCLGYIAFINRRNKRDKWETYLLIPIFLFFVVELVLDYILNFDFRSTALVGPYVLFYFVGLWGLIGYAFRFDKKWGFLTLVTYFLNMSLSVLQHFV